jgi:hypothetical protein
MCKEGMSIQIYLRCPGWDSLYAKKLVTNLGWDAIIVEKRLPFSGWRLFG